MAYAAPGAMGKRRLARNTPKASEGLEATPYDAPYGRLRSKSVLSCLNFNLEAQRRDFSSEVKVKKR